MHFLLQTAGLFAFSVVLFLAAPAAQAMQLRLEPDATKLVALAGQPATVIVGNPVYADVTVLDKKILVQGRSPGKTSIIVMNSQGEQIAKLAVIVANTSPDRLTVYKNGERYSYLCLPDCERTLNVGDSEAASSTLSAQIQRKLDVARAAAQISR